MTNRSSRADTLTSTMFHFQMRLQQEANHKIAELAGKAHTEAIE